MRARLAFAGLVACALGVLPGSAAAVIGGQPDGDGHPYVGLVTNNAVTCSGVLVSPTVMLTAAHCFGGPAVVAVSFEPQPPRTWHLGVFYPDPQFGSTGNGTPQTNSHDLAIVVFGSKDCFVPSTSPPGATCGSITSSRYASLPTQGLVDTLPMKAPIDLVGYGVQDIVRGGGQPQLGPFGTRIVAQTTLIAGNDRLSQTFLKLHSGPCFGDSGGPDLLGGTDTVLAVNSFLNSNLCAGDAYSTRVDTAQALGWISAAAAAHGGSLSG